MHIDILRLNFQFLFLDGHAAFAAFDIEAFVSGFDSLAAAAFGGDIMFLGFDSAAFTILD